MDVRPFVDAEHVGRHCVKRAGHRFGAHCRQWAPKRLIKAAGACSIQRHVLRAAFTSFSWRRRRLAVAVSQGLEPPLLARKTTLLKLRMYLPGKSTDWKDVP